MYHFPVMFSVIRAELDVLPPELLDCWASLAYVTRLLHMDNSELDAATFDVEFDDAIADFKRAYVSCFSEDMIWICQRYQRCTFGSNVSKSP